jgi:hypothetical protein
MIVEYLDHIDVEPRSVGEWDDLFLEWKNGVDMPDNLRKPTRGQFEKALSALEKICPHYKGHLVFARAVAGAWKVAFKPQHTKALVPRWRHVVADGMLDLNRPRAAACLHIQGSRGLRPGEAVALRGRDVVLPEECPGAGGTAILLLGARRGTKSGRQQFVFVPDPYDILVLRLLKVITADDSLLFGLKHLGPYGALISAGCICKGLRNTGWSPHSGRAGFATAMVLLHGYKVLPEVCEICRWSSKKSAKVYLDVVGVAASQQSIELERDFGTVADTAGQHFPGRLLDALKVLAAAQLRPVLNEWSGSTGILPWGNSAKLAPAPGKSG